MMHERDRQPPKASYPEANESTQRPNNYFGERQRSYDQILSAYYTLGAVASEEQQQSHQKASTHHISDTRLRVPLPTQSRQNSVTELTPYCEMRKTSSLRNSFKEEEYQAEKQVEYKPNVDQTSQMKELILKADKALRKNADLILAYPKGFSESTLEIQENENEKQRQSSSLRFSQQNTQADGKYAQEYKNSAAEDGLRQEMSRNLDDRGHFQASNHYSHRMAELQRQCHEVSKLPEFYNDRVATLKKRTHELQVAVSYTSNEDQDGKMHLDNVQDSQDQRRVSFDNEQLGADHYYRGCANDDNKYNNQHSSSALLAGVQESETVDEQDSQARSQDRQNKVSSSYLGVYQQQQPNVFVNSDAALQRQNGYNNDLNTSNRFDLNQRETKNPSQLCHATEVIVDEGDPRLDYPRKVEPAEELHEAASDFIIQNERSQMALGLDRSEPTQILSQQLITSLCQQHDLNNEFELTRKLEQHAFSHDTYRVPQTQQDTLTTEKNDENHNIDKDKLQKKLRRREKRERKLQKLKELHEMAQFSMTQIASNLSSHATSTLCKPGERQGIAQQQTNKGNNDANLQSSQCLTDTVLMSMDDRGIMDNRQESVKGRVERISNTRSEIKKLIKIQNKHGKLLKQLQSSGVIKNAQVDGQTSKASLSQLSDNHKPYQEAMSSQLLQQMQEIFKYLAQIQHKLDFEIDERRKRTGQIEQNQNGHQESKSQLQNQILNARVVSLGGSQQTSHDKPQFLMSNQSQNPYNAQQNPNDSNMINNVSQGTHSTLFWDTQMAYNQSNIFQGSKNNLQSLQQYQSNHQKGMTQGSQYQDNAIVKEIQDGQQENCDIRTTESDNEESYGVINHQKKDDKGLNDLPQAVLQSGEQQKARTYPTQSEDGLESHRMNENFECGGGQVEQNTLCATELQQQNSNHMSITQGSQSLNGIRADQLCEILSREIGRVREESMQQAQDMRLQYEHELQALRNEFYSQQKHEVRQMQNELFQNDIEEDGPLYMIQHHQAATTTDLTSEMAGPTEGGLTQRISNNGTLSGYNYSNIHHDGDNQQYLAPSQPQFQQTAVANPGNSDLLIQENLTVDEHGSGAMIPGSQHARTLSQQEIKQISQPVFDELEKVKAERDLYHAKLMRVRTRIEHGKNERFQQILSTNQSQRTASMGGSASNLDHSHRNDAMSKLQQYQIDFMIQPPVLAVQKNRHQDQIQIGGAILTQDSSFDRQQQQHWPSKEIQFQQSKDMCTFQHDSSEKQRRQQNGIESNPSHFTYTQAQRPPTAPLGCNKISLTSQTLKQQLAVNTESGKIHNTAGSIVASQFRSFQERDSSLNTSETSKAKNAKNVKEADLCKKSSKYVNVRHNRTSLLRQNKMVRDTLVQKCNNCLQSSAEAGAKASATYRGSSQERSFISDRSSTQGTFKNVKAYQNFNVQESCTSCNEKIVSRPTSPFIKGKTDKSQQNCTSAMSSSLASNCKTVVDHIRPLTPNNDQLTFSNKVGRSSTLNSQDKNQAHQLQQPALSTSSGGIQTLIPRSPSLINRLAAEHDLYNQQQTQQYVENNTMNLTYNSSINDNEHRTNHQTSRALQVINHYLEKYDSAKK